MLIFRSKKGTSAIITIKRDNFNDIKVIIIDNLNSQLPIVKNNRRIGGIVQHNRSVC